MLPVDLIVLEADLINGFPAKPADGSVASSEQANGPAANAVVGTTDAVEIKVIAPNSAVVSAANAFPCIVVLPVCNALLLVNLSRLRSGAGAPNVSNPADLRTYDFRGRIAASPSFYCAVNSSPDFGR